MTEQVLDARASMRVIRHSWKLVTVLAALGAAIMGAYESVTPPKYHSSALVLVPSPSNAAGATTSHGQTTELRIALSAGVLVPAARSVDPSLTLQAMQTAISAAATAPSILQISASASNPLRSKELANAVATQLVEFETKTAASMSSTAVAALQADATQLEAQIADDKKELTLVQQRIAAEGETSASGRQDSELATQLASDESALNLQLSNVKSEISQAQLGTVSAAQGTEVIQRASTGMPPSKRALAMPVGLGALAGAFAGSFLVLFRNRRDRRVRTRDAVAEALGAPVLLASDVPARKTSKDWVQLFERHEPSALEQWGARKAFRELGVDEHDGLLEILCFDRDECAVTLAAELAVASAVSDRPTTFSVTAERGLAAPLQIACGRFDDEVTTPRPNLRIVSNTQKLPDRAGLVVIALVLDKDKPHLENAQRRSDRTTLMAISASFASADELARVAIAAADSGRPIRGAVLANPAPDDETSGRPPGVTGRKALAELRGPSVALPAPFGRPR